MTDLLSFGPWLKQRRRHLDYTQARLAADLPCGWTAGTIVYAVNDDRMPPVVYPLVTLAPGGGDLAIIETSCAVSRRAIARVSSGEAETIARLQRATTQQLLDELARRGVSVGAS